MRSRLQFVLGTLCVYGLAGSSAFSDTAYVPAMPSNIIVDRGLQDIVAEMARRSPTFRDQSGYLGRIAELRVRIVVRGSLAPWGQTQCRAEALLQRYQYGRIEAFVRLTSRDDAVELIAHELEHVREYVEGVKFRFLAARRRWDVWDTSSGHFETARAIAVGLRVAREVKEEIAPE